MNVKETTNTMYLIIKVAYKRFTNVNQEANNNNQQTTTKKQGTKQNN